jgi:hypothetical protein
MRLRAFTHTIRQPKSFLLLTTWYKTSNGGYIYTLHPSFTWLSLAILLGRSYICLAFVDYMRGVGIPIYTFRRILDYRRVSQSKLHTAILRNSMLIRLLEIPYMGILDIQHLQNSSYIIFHNYGFILQDISTLIILESPSALFFMKYPPRLVNCGS